MCGGPLRPVHLGVRWPVHVSVLPETCRLVPVVSGPRAELVLILGGLWSRPSHFCGAPPPCCAVAVRGDGNGNATADAARSWKDPSCEEAIPGRCAHWSRSASRGAGTAQVFPVVSRTDLVARMPHPNFPSMVRASLFQP